MVRLTFSIGCPRARAPRATAHHSMHVAESVGAAHSLDDSRIVVSNVGHPAAGVRCLCPACAVIHLSSPPVVDSCSCVSTTDDIIPTIAFRIILRGEESIQDMVCIVMDSGRSD